MSQLSLNNFLKDSCGFKENVIADVSFKLTEQGIDSVEMLFDLSIEDLQEINLSKIQSVVITKKAKALIDQPPESVEDSQTPNTSDVSQNHHANHQQDDLNLDKLPKQQDDDVHQIDTSSNPDEKVALKKLIRPTGANDQFRPASGNKKPGSLEVRMSTDNEQFVLFESFEDVGSEYKMSKIRLNEEQFRHLSKMIKENEVFPAAFYGDFDKCVQASYEYLGIVIPLKEHKIKEGILVLKNGNKLALIYKTVNNEIFDYKKAAADQAHLASTYLRYLIDLCQTIVICPNDDFQMNPDLSNPFKASCNDRFVLKEEIIVPDEKVQIKQIPYAGEMSNKHDFKQVATSFDQSKFLPQIKVTKDLVENIVRQNFTTSQIYGQYSFYSTQKLYSYDELKALIIEKWPQEKDYFSSTYYFSRPFEDKIKIIMQSFVPYQSYSTLSQLAGQHQDRYLEKYQIMKDQLLSNQYAQFQPLYEEFFQAIEQFNCKQFKEALENSQQETKSSSFWEDLKNKFSFEKKEDMKPKLKCTGNCSKQSFDTIMYKFRDRCKDINWQDFSDYQKKQSLMYQLNVHHIYEDSFKKLLEQINNKSKEIKNKLNQDKNQNLYNLKETTLIEFFSECDALVTKLKTSFKSKATINFLKINIVRDKDHKVDSWNITKDQVMLQAEFKNHSSDIKIKDVFFTSDNSGLLLFENSPENKNSIYYFNTTNKSQISITLLLTLGSTDSNLIVEPQQKQWCTFDNREKRVNIGKLTKDGKIEDGAPIGVYDIMTDGHIISSIKSACFLPQGDRIFILNQNNTLFQFQWQSRQLTVIFKKVNEDTPGERSMSGVKKIKIEPKDPSNSYEQVQVTPDGKYIILQGKKILDIFDLNWDLTQSFPLGEDFQFIKTFTDKINSFIVIFSSVDYKCYQLVGLTATKQITTQIKGIKSNQEILGNPIFDHFYHSFQKYGPHSDFIFAPSSTQIYFYDKRARQPSDQNLLKRYFNQLGIQNVQIEIMKKIEQIFENEIEEIKTKSFLMIAMSRVSIHVATIENSTLVPLNNGKNISDQITENLIKSDQKTDMIQRITAFINFGIYEEFLSGLSNKRVKVVSIVGRQSSGKSYVMNRLFGTRFNVAATRCTDGVWMSVVHINNFTEEPEIFMILDCEGLFSARRNEQEEMKLCLALSAISDIMILNQDLSFNRYLNSLFGSFSRSIGRIKGKKLFKGTLMMLIRDIVKGDSRGAYQELESNIRQLQGTSNNTFLGAVFGGRLISQCLNFFQMPIFDQEIEGCRQIFIEEINDRWMNGSDLVESFKIVLAQVFSDDDTDIDVHKIKISCEHAFNQALEIFYNGGERFQETQILKEVEISLIKYRINANQKDILLAREPILEENDLEETFPLTEEILNSFISNSVGYEQKIHNDWIKSFGGFIKELLIQRKDYTLNYFTEQLPKDQEFEDVVSTYLFKLKNIFEIYISKLLYCDKTCRSCKRLCALRINHSKNCDCETYHICQEPCQKSEECKKSKNLCVGVFGHDQEHRCGEGNHKCSSMCEKPDCKYLCQYDAGHDTSESHDCGNKHPCSAKCEDKSCLRTCQYDSCFDHDLHTCGESKCIHKCKFCDRQCIFPHHLHSKLIDEGDSSQLIFKPSEVLEGILFDYHICENQHSCEQQCEQPGVCSIDYKIEERVWKNEFGEFPYRYFEPLDTRVKCKILIEKFMKNHDSNHNCKIATGHRCFHQCPECKSFCNKDIDHEGMHKSNNHRNKENNVFVTSKGKDSIQITEGGKKREYKAGESCQPEDCTQSCSRKGRAHYHLKECTSLETCAALINPNVKHSTEKFHPYTDKVFDKWLCNSYWHSIKWEQPIEGEYLNQAALCNYVCCHPSHSELKYCNGNAWHSDPHSFDCDHKTGSSNIIDIVFCMDTTGSMSSYIEKSKDAVRKIIKDINALPSSGERSIKFGFVAYKDHPPQDPTYVTKVQPLTDEPAVQTFINSLSASGGGDGPESVLDGLYDSINKCGYRDTAIKYLFHIGDAPPHGRIYTGGSGDHWPEGCPCGIKIETLAAQMKTQNIRYKLLKIGSYPNTMAAEFKKHIENFEESDLDSAVQLDIKMSEILVRDIRQEDDDITMS